MPLHISLCGEWQNNAHRWDESSLSGQFMSKVLLHLHKCETISLIAPWDIPFGPIPSINALNTPSLRRLLIRNESVMDDSRKARVFRFFNPDDSQVPTYLLELHTNSNIEQLIVDCRYCRNPRVHEWCMTTLDTEAGLPHLSVLEVYLPFTPFRGGRHVQRLISRFPALQHCKLHIGVQLSDAAQLDEPRVTDSDRASPCAMASLETLQIQASIFPVDQGPLELSYVFDNFLVPKLRSLSIGLLNGGPNCQPLAESLEKMILVSNSAREQSQDDQCGLKNFIVKSHLDQWGDTQVDHLVPFIDFLSSCHSIEILSIECTGR
jgi:hypothetical protein